MDHGLQHSAASPDGNSCASSRLWSNSSPTDRWRPHVLLIAEAANPEWVSVPLEGWELARALRQVADVHVVTQVRNRDALIRAGWKEGVDFTAIDSEAVARPLSHLAEKLRGGKGKGWTMVTALAGLAYYEFERLLWRRFGKDIKSGRYDLIHRLTPISPTTPSIIAGRCRRAGVPFVWGPVNGGVPWPRGFDAQRRQEKEWLSYARGLHRLLPGYRQTRRCAAAIVTGSLDARQQMSAAVADRCVYIPENAINPAKFPLLESRFEQITLPLRLVFNGRLVPYKGPDMLVEAAAPLLRNGQATLQIVGDGPMMGDLRRLIAARGVERGVTFSGWVPHDELANQLCRSHVFAFPSIREFGGAVVLEAMALGLVPIVVNYGGPGEHVTDATGFRIPMGPREQIIRDFQAHLLRIVKDPSILPAMAEAGRKRVALLYTWAAKAAQMRQVYDWAMGRLAKPDFTGAFFPPDGPAAAAPGHSDAPTLQPALGV